MDTSRHKDIFDPSKFHGRIAIVGCGSLGSALAIQIAKLGLGDKLHLYDDDKIEGHNIPNQILFGPDDIGLDKAAVVTERIQLLTGQTPQYFTHRVETRHDLNSESHIFVCVDRMDIRKQIFAACVFLNPNVFYFADGRLGSRTAMTYSFDPQDLRKSKEYKARWYPDEDVAPETGGCGFSLSLGATAMMVACAMTWNFMEHMNHLWDDIKTAVPFNELAFRCDTVEMTSKGYL